MRSERCACGGWIDAWPDDPEAIQAAVRAHNRTRAHRLWRTRARRVETTREWRRRIRAEVELARLRRGLRGREAELAGIVAA